MKKIILDTSHRLLLCLVCAALIGIGCQRETPDSDLDSDRQMVTLRFKVNSNALSEATDLGQVEQMVTHLRVIAFRSGDGLVSYNKFFGSIPASMELNVNIREDFSDVYVILNEPNTTLNSQNIVGSEAFDRVDFLRNFEVMKIEPSLIYPPQTMPEVSPYTMIKRYKKSSLSANEDGVITLGKSQEDGQERVFSKISLGVNYNKELIKPADFAGEIVITKLQVFNVPNYSYVDQGQYTDDFSSINIDVKKSTKGEGDGVTTTYGNVFYLPEHIINNAANKTYIKVTGTNQTLGVLSWTIDLGNAAVTGASQDARFDIVRNNHYVVDAKLRSYGTSDADVTVSVSPWNRVSIDESLGESHIIIDGEQSGSVIGSSGEVELEIYETELEDSTLKVLVGGDYDQLKITSTMDRKYKVLEIDKNTSYLKIQAATLGESSKYDVLKLELGSVTKTIVVRQMQFIMLFAEGNLKANPSGRVNDLPVIATVSHDYPAQEQTAFMWGSLLGIAPYKTPNGRGVYVDKGITFRPVEYKAINIPVATAPVSNRLSNTEYKERGGIDKNHMPKFDTPSTAQGDICRHALGQWHTPTLEEYNRLFNYKVHDAHGGRVFGEQYNNLKGVYEIDVMKNICLYLPMQTFRDVGGAQYPIDMMFYWSSSYSLAGDNTYGAVCDGQAKGVRPHYLLFGGDQNNRGYASMVRCIRDHKNGRPLVKYTYPK